MMGQLQEDIERLREIVSDDEDPEYTGERAALKRLLVPLTALASLSEGETAYLVETAAHMRDGFACAMSDDGKPFVGESAWRKLALILSTEGG